MGTPQGRTASRAWNGTRTMLPPLYGSLGLHGYVFRFRVGRGGDLERDGVGGYGTPGPLIARSTKDRGRPAPKSHEGTRRTQNRSIWR